MNNVFIGGIGAVKSKIEQKAINEILNFYGSKTFADLAKNKKFKSFVNKVAKYHNEQILGYNVSGSDISIYLTRTLLVFRLIAGKLIPIREAIIHKI